MCRNLRAGEPEEEARRLRDVSNRERESRRGKGPQAWREPDRARRLEAQDRPLTEEVREMVSRVG
jgi:hypothetical protein